MNMTQFDDITINKWEAVAIIIDAYNAGVVTEGLAAQALGFNRIEFRWLLEEVDPPALRALGFCERNPEVIASTKKSKEDVIEMFRAGAKARGVKSTLIQGSDVP